MRNSLGVFAFHLTSTHGSVNRVWMTASTDMKVRSFVASLPSLSTPPRVMVVPPRPWPPLMRTVSLSRSLHTCENFM